MHVLGGGRQPRALFERLVPGSDKGNLHRAFVAAPARGGKQRNQHGGKAQMAVHRRKP